MRLFPSLQPGETPTDIVVAGTAFAAQRQYGDVNDELRRTFSRPNQPEPEPVVTVAPSYQKAAAPKPPTASRVVDEDALQKLK